MQSSIQCSDLHENYNLQQLNNNTIIKKVLWKTFKKVTMDVNESYRKLKSSLNKNVLMKVLKVNTYSTQTASWTLLKLLQ